jgi:cobalt-zinc-cadmium resistance protein CzcA
LVLCLSLGLRLGTEFLPKLEEGNLWIRAVMPPTITLEAGMETVAKIRAVISSYPPVQTVFSEQGRGDRVPIPTVRSSPSSLSRSSRPTSGRPD